MRNNGNKSKFKSNSNAPRQGKRSGAKRTKNQNYQDEAMINEKRKGFREAGNDASRVLKNNGKGCVPVEIGVAQNNDPSWYVPTGQMVKDVAAIPQTLQSGYPIDLIKVTDLYGAFVHNYQQNGCGTSEFVHASTVVPGVCAIELAPSLGSPEDVNAPINVAAKVLYTSLQTKSARNPQYGMNDVALYLTAMADIYSMYNWLVRLYGVALNFSLFDKYTPVGIFKAENVSYYQLSGNLALYRAVLNEVAYKINAMYCPKNIPFISRKVFLYESVYLDSNTNKAQYYLYTPNSFYKWYEGDTEEALTYLQTIDVRDVTDPFELINVLKGMIESILESEDVRMMSADMFNTFGAGNAIVLNQIAETFTVSPAYDAEVLMQMENAYLLGLTKYKSRIYQNEGINEDYVKESSQGSIDIGFGAKTTGTEVWTTSLDTKRTQLLNFHKTDVTPEDLLVSSRLATPSKLVWSGATDYTVNVYSDWTEVPMRAHIVTYTRSSYPKLVVDLYDESVFTNQVVRGTQKLDMMTQVGKVANLSRFDWAPRVRVLFETETSGKADVNCSGDFWDLDNYYMMSYDELVRMDRIAMLGMFRVDLPNVLPM